MSTEDDIVISGISGKFPNASNLSEQFYKNSVDQKPIKTKRIEKIEKFDSNFFEINEKKYKTPEDRLLLECTYEAIFDAGINPLTLKNEKIGVFVTGSSKSNMAQSISTSLQLSGPSYVINSENCSSFYAIDSAFEAIKTQKCAAAIVGGVHLISESNSNKLESVCVILLQQYRHARRLYATILKSKINFNPSKEFIEEFYAGVGHIETLNDDTCDTKAVSGLCAVAKAVLIFQKGLLSPRNTANCDLIGIDAVGGHLVLQKGLIKRNIMACLPSLLIWSGRTVDACNEILSKAKNIEQIALLNEIQRVAIPKNKYRAYGVLSNQNISLREVKEFNSTTSRPLVWVYSGMGSQWNEMGKSLLKIKTFKKSIDGLQKVLKSKSIDLIQIITAKDPDVFKESVNSFVGITAVQIGITDVLNELGIVPDFIIGHSLGELGCAYADGCLTAEEMILSAYETAIACKEVNLVPGSMAAIGLNQRETREILSADLEVACHNGIDSCTVSGPIDTVKSFVQKCNETGIFAREVPGACIPSHSKYVSAVGPKLLGKLNKILTSPKQRSNKWISTSQKHENSFYTADYQVNNLLSTVLFEEATGRLPENSVTIEIAPHGLLQTILKKSLPSGDHIHLTKRGSTVDNVEVFFSGLGKLFINGIRVDFEKLYQPIVFPVSSDTPMISPLILWDHSQNHQVGKKEFSKNNDHLYKINLSDPKYSFASGHVIDGRVIFPATGYLCLVWETFAAMKDQNQLELNVEFCDLRFLRATNLPENTDVNLSVSIHKGTGRFEITENKTAIVTGIIREKVDLKIVKSVRQMSKASALDSQSFYKELRLRGFHYNGIFQSVSEVQHDGRSGKIEWHSNYTVFMDCLLQIAILAKDTRSLVLPTRIDVVRINPTLHLNMIIDGHVEVETINELNTIKAGGIEIKGMATSSVPRRRPPGNLVLEQFSFISNTPSDELSVTDAANICLQTMLENTRNLNPKIIEVVNEREIVIETFKHILDMIPTVELTLILITLETKRELQGGITVDTTKLKSHKNCTFLILDGSNLDQIEDSLSDTANILCRERKRFDIKKLRVYQKFDVINVILTKHETWLLLLYKREKETKVSRIIRASNTDFAWIEEIKKSKPNDKILLFAQSFCGLLSLVNDIQAEVNKVKITCVFVNDSTAPELDVNHSFYKKQLDLGLTVNIYENNTWGSYRHFQLTDNLKLHSEDKQYYVNALIRGDLSSLKWQERNIILGTINLVTINYASLNFRDVMLATGKLSDDFIDGTRCSRQCVLGLEFSGCIRDRRVMGIVNSGALATHVESDPELTWNVPDHWSLEAAATVPLVYLTVYTSFFLKANIEKGRKILIHAGTGGVGLAAIRVAFAYDLEVYTTVSTQEKREYLLSMFPKLRAENIGNSRDLSFYEMIMHQTNGSGVDYILNSLAEEKLLVSVKCLAEGGHFLEIGKFDITNDHKIGLGHFINEITFHVIMVDKLYKAADTTKKTLHELIDRDIKRGIIMPLKTTVFKANEVELAFRFLASGKHMGKVLLKIRENETNKKILPLQVLPKVYCDPNLTYIIVGSLQHFDLEFTDWITLRGCKKLILNSLNQETMSSYLKYRIELWTSYGVDLELNTVDLADFENCQKFIKNIDNVGGIFIFIDNQNLVSAVKHLDEISEKWCSKLHLFVISCTKYGSSITKSMLEKTIEARCSKGLPSKIIKWGPIGELNHIISLSDVDRVMHKLYEQRIDSCLKELDTLLTVQQPIVSSKVIVEKLNSTTSSVDVVGAVMRIMGLRDAKLVSMDSSLSNLGMDSLMSVEVSQMLERNYEISLSSDELAAVSFEKLKNLSQQQQNKEKK